jgi:zinc transporter, ZIP family
MATLVLPRGADLAAIKDMIVEAHESVQDTRGSVLTPVGGFVVFALVSAGLGGETS